MYKGQAWYLHAFCTQKQEVRTFRLSRIKEVELQQQSFIKKEPKSFPSSQKTLAHSPSLNLKLRFSPDILYRLYDEFDENQITPNEDGSYDVLLNYPENEWLYGYILSFGNYVTVLEPPHIREIILQKLKLTLSRYAPQ